MTLAVRCLGWFVIVVAIVFDIDGAVSQTRLSMSINVTNGLYPVVNGATNLGEGTSLFVLVRKPWLPDGQQRVSRGQAACGEDCFPAEGPDRTHGATVTIKNGSFAAGPFSFNGMAFRPGIYPLEITIVPRNPKTATIEEIRAMSSPIYISTIQVGDLR